MSSATPRSFGCCALVCCKGKRRGAWTCRLARCNTSSGGTCRAKGQDMAEKQHKVVVRVTLARAEGDIKALVRS